MNMKMTMWIDIVAVLAVLQFLYFGVLVGKARGQYGIKAPATSGHEMFDRAYRVHMNTLEVLVTLLPAMYLAGRYWSPVMVALAGCVYLIGRFIYARAYVENPGGRSLGFGLSVAPVFGLLAAALAGAVIGLSG